MISGFTTRYVLPLKQTPREEAIIPHVNVLYSSPPVVYEAAERVWWNDDAICFVLGSPR